MNEPVNFTSTGPNTASMVSSPRITGSHLSFLYQITYKLASSHKHTSTIPSVRAAVNVTIEHRQPVMMMKRKMTLRLVVFVLGGCSMAT